VLRADRCHDDTGDWVRVEVRDNGPGIPSERMQSLFRSFEQTDGSSTRVVGGLGLGLALARLLAERMDGRLTADSADGQGAVFTLLLPVA